MDVATIEMPVEEARAAYKDYAEAVKRKDPDPTDEALMRGYKFLAEDEGRRLLKLTDTFTAAGFDERGLPRLAIMRAGTARCRVCTGAPGPRGSITFVGDNDFSRTRHRNRIVVPGVVPGEGPKVNTYDGWTALTPIVPPALRPKRGVTRYHILWEAEWFVDRQAAPIDPYLLRHLIGDLWAVIAAWNLTELERAVLVGRS